MPSNLVLDAGVQAQRNPTYYLANTVLMMFFVVGLTFTCFGLESFSDRINIAVTLVLTSVALKLLTAEQLPDLPYMTWIDRYMLVGIGLQQLIAIQCVALEHLVPPALRVEVNFYSGICISACWVLPHCRLLWPLFKPG